MRIKFMALLMSVVFLAAIGSPVLAAPMHQGRPSAYDTGSYTGYYVWQEGDRWQVRTVNGGSQRLFTGKVETDGTFNEVITMQSEKVERIAVTAENKKIEFHFSSQAKTDGFSFLLSNSQNAVFTLYIDGRPADAASIYLGRQNRHPNNHSFPINASNDNISNPYANPPAVSFRFQGQPTALTAGNSLGYFIWQEGDRWIMKTMTRGAQRSFTGTIGTSSRISNVNRLNLEDNDFVRFNEAGNEISFDLKTMGEEDGLSFQMNSGTDATFTLYLDGQPVNTSNIYLGSQNYQPIANPFNIRSSDEQYSSNNNRVYPSDQTTVPNTTYNSSTSSYQTIASANAQGQPSAFNSGKVFGYFLWQDAENRWNLQTTTTGDERHFTGTIESNGVLQDARLMSGQRSNGNTMDASSTKISFAFKTGGSASGISITLGEGIHLNQPDKVGGLSFLATEGAAVDFRLYVDGQAVDPGSIYLGSANMHPSGNTLKIYSSN